MTARTCRNWLEQLGFKWKIKQGNGVYHDGHERADVKADLHKRFLPRVQKLLRRTRMMREVTTHAHMSQSHVSHLFVHIWSVQHNHQPCTHKVIDVETGTKSWVEIPPELAEGEREVIWVNQDESLFYANDDDFGMWCELKKKYIGPKGKGPKVHLSGLIEYPSGEWVDIETIEPEKDGMWSIERLEEQTKRVLARLEAKYPRDKYEIVFTFDHSTIHAKLPADALRVTQMNLNPGGEKGWCHMPHTHASSPTPPHNVVTVLCFVCR